MSSSNAFILIRAMEMSEKRHFRIFGKRHVIGKRNKYEILFEALDRSPVYDEEELRKSVRSSGFDPRFIKADQNYLYHLLLRSLREFHSGKSWALLIKEHLQEIEILYDKGLYHQCGKEIVKCRSLCMAYEHFDLWAHLLYWERKLSIQNTGHARREKEVLAEMKKVNSLAADLIRYTQLHHDAAELRTGVIVARNKQAMERFSVFLNQDALKDEQSAGSINSKIRFHQVHALWQNVNGDKKKELHHNERILRLMGEPANFREEFPLDHISIASRVLSITKDLYPARFAHELARFRSIHVEKGSVAAKRVRAQIFNFSYMMQLSMLINSSSFREARSLVGEVEEGFEEFGELLPATSRITLLYMLAYIAYAAGELRTARKKINRILNEFEPALRPDIRNFARLMNLLIHFDERNFTSIRSEISSISYYFRKHSLTYKTENLILRFMSNADKLKKADKNDLISLKEKLDQVRNEKLEGQAMRYFDLSLWAESKIRRKPMEKL